MSTLARVGAVAAVTAGGIALAMLATLAAVIEAAIRCDRDLEGYDWADDDTLTSAERLDRFATLGPVVTVGPNVQSVTASRATW